MSVLTYPYDSAYNPAFPVIEIEVDGYSQVHGRQRITALVDSGADGTMLPHEVLQMVGATYEDSVQMKGITGGVQTVDRYTVTIRVGEHLVRTVHAVALPAGSEAIVGRDVLNELHVALNGPANMTEILPE